MSAYQGENSDTIQIERQAFLLSYTEMARRGSGYIHEGKPLKYFKDDFTRMKTTDENGKESGWWLRTSSMGYPTVAIGVGSDGRVGFAAVSVVAGVRPAFCLPGDVGIEEGEEVVPGENVYVIR